jgi:NAD(P)-dependent dehydrogenase (short-subunit alcohol dehydrogenase family)
MVRKNLLNSHGIVFMTTLSADVLSTFDNKLHIVLVGASGGIGQAIIKRLLCDDRVEAVYGLSRTEQRFDDPRYHYSKINYEDESTIASAIAQLPSELDMVIVATGLLHDGAEVQPEKSFKQLSMTSLHKTMLVNMIGPSLVAKYCLPAMRKESKTVFAALSARVGSISDNRLGGWYGYRASKAALNMILKTFSIELRRTHPQSVIVGLHPGTVDTHLSQPFQRNVSAQQLFTVDFSAECLLTVINQLQPADSGDCFAWDGKKVPA